MRWPYASFGVDTARRARWLKRKCEGSMDCRSSGNITLTAPSSVVKTSTVETNQGTLALIDTAGSSI
jgi:hypothetical protein